MGVMYGQNKGYVGIRQKKMEATIQGRGLRVFILGVILVAL